ncbi:hypothetical protein BB8028_0005g02450 [Beauveria bassiana]|uniref:Uncharacterized protein n=1 Tax=Beauveria bassiana TaxID=176275 RepID=A0A2S7YEY6_BEABA|nr:hypothetical protein BB8028_0005g02450 [Beauveria bassiana]
MRSPNANLLLCAVSLRRCNKYIRKTASATRKMDYLVEINGISKSVKLIKLTRQPISCISYTAAAHRHPFAILFP